jgi:hypothetical protein
MENLRDDVSRRRFLHAFAQATLGVSVLDGALSGAEIAAPSVGAEKLAPAAASIGRKAVGRAKNVIYVYFRGGISHIDTFDPKPGRPEMGGVKPIDTDVAGLQISEWLPNLARRMHQVALVRSMTSTQGVHERGNYLAHTSYFQTPTISHPALGAWALTRLGSENKLLPGNVLINGSPQHPGSGYMGSHLAPLPIVDPEAGLQNSKLLDRVTPTDFSRRTELARMLGQGFLERTPHRTAQGYRRMHEEAVGLMKSKDLKAFDISQEDRKTQERYGTHTFGQACLLARRLVEHGVRYIEVDEGQNWDTHNDHHAQMEKMIPTADQTLTALLADLEERGLAESTLVVFATEFGRTPKLSEVTAGRGHHPAAFSWWLAGAGIRGGTVYGRTDAAGERVADKPVNMQDFNATIALAMGIDLKKTEISPSGRPFTVANDGKPLMELFS